MTQKPTRTLQADPFESLTQFCDTSLMSAGEDTVGVA